MESMNVWLSRMVPPLAAALVVLVADVAEPVTDRVSAPAMLPAVIVSTWAVGWSGGLTALGVAFAGRLVMVEAPPWLHMQWTLAWLALCLLAIAATAAARRAHLERVHARRVQREQAERAAMALETRRARFLAHATDVLRTSADYQTTLAAVANLAVPQVADICVVDLVNDKGEFSPLAVAHVDSRNEHLVRELRRMYPLDPAAPYGPPRVLRTGQSVIYSDLPESAAADTSIHPSELRVALALGIRSTMAVPLLVGGRRLGVISFATIESGRRFVASDLQFAEALARRVAIAIDTARP
jgi:GAF domain-containing protein